jgi:hypothetical protein
MSFLSQLFGKKTIIQDEVFGILVLDSRKSDDCHFLNESLFFTPIGQEISCSVEAGPQGPTENQRVFFQKVLTDYGQLISQIKPLIEVELSVFQGRSKTIEIMDFEQECQLVGINIPQIISSPVRWSWSFETIHDPNHMATIYMIGHSSQTGVQFDG